MAVSGLVTGTNIVVQHNPTPNGFETGERGAYETPLRDKVHGRIYRIVPVARAIDDSLQLSSSSPIDELIRALSSRNMFWRLHAQRLLVESGDVTIATKLIPVISDHSVDEIGLNVGAIHGLRVLQGLRSQSELSRDVMDAWYTALRHPSAATRRTAALSLPASPESLKQIVQAGLLLDSEPLVRLAACTAISDAAVVLSAGNDRPENSELSKQLVRSLLDETTAKDRWLPDAITSSAAGCDFEFLTAIASFKPDAPVGRHVQLVVERVAEHYARGGELRNLESLLTSLSAASPEVSAAVIGGISEGLPENRRPALTDGIEQSLVALFDSSDASGKLRVIALAQRWGSRRVETQAAALAAELLAVAGNGELDVNQRIAAITDLGSIRRDDQDVTRTIVELLDARTEPEFVVATVRAFQSSTADALGEQLAAAAVRLTRQIVLRSCAVCW